MMELDKARRVYRNYVPPLKPLIPGEQSLINSNKKIQMRSSCDYKSVDS